MARFGSIADVACYAALLLPAAALAAGRAEPASRPALALFASERAELTAALAEGARLALDQARTAGGPELELIVVETAAGSSTPWGNAASEAARLLARAEVLAIVTPPERAPAHLLAQIGTRAQVPIISTSPVPSVTATGSGWLRSVVTSSANAAAGGASQDAAPVSSTGLVASEFERTYRSRYGRLPPPAAAAGFDAARVVLEALRRGGPGRAGVRAGLSDGRPIAGANGPILFDRLGRRRAGR